jgi:hypothetical protein
MRQLDGLEISSTGTKRYYQNGIYHRVDGPAVEFLDGVKIWYQNGKLHREDGPAVEWPEKVQYYLYDKEIESLEKLQHLVKMKAFW